MATLQAWLDTRLRPGERVFDFGNPALLHDVRYRTNFLAGVTAAGCGYWLVVPPLVGMRKIRNKVWLEFVEADLNPSLRNAAYRSALRDAMTLQPHVLFPIHPSYSPIPGFNYAMRWYLYEGFRPQLSGEFNTPFARWTASWLVTIGAWTLADASFLWFNKLIMKGRPLQVALAEEGRASNIFNQYRVLKRADKLTNFTDGWRRQLMRAVYMWGPANATFEMAKYHWGKGPDGVVNKIFGAMLGSLIGTFLQGTREILYENPIREWSAETFQQRLTEHYQGIPHSGIAGIRHRMASKTPIQIVTELIFQYKLHYRPWALTFQLLLFDQLISLAHRWQWGVRAWNKPYEAMPTQLDALHEKFPSLPKPPPVLDENIINKDNKI